MAQENSQTNFGDKALSVGYKLGGWDLRFRAIGSFIGAAVAFIASLFFLVGSFTSNGGSALLFFFVLLLIISIATLLVGLYNWKRAKSLVKGRYY